jgi:hypothetical protein
MLCRGMKLPKVVGSTDSSATGMGSIVRRYTSFLAAQREIVVLQSGTPRLLDLAAVPSEATERCQNYAEFIYAQDFSSLDAEESSCFRELCAILFVLLVECSTWRGCCVAFFTDNSQVPSRIRVGSNKPLIQGVCAAIVDISFAYKIVCSFTWVPREQLVNADAASRIRDPHDYSISEEGFRRLFGTNGVWKLEPSLDLFADWQNSRCLHFMSLRPSPGCIGVNTLDPATEIPSRFVWLYAFPPFNILEQCIRKILDWQRPVFLIFPLASKFSPAWRLLMRDAHHFIPAVQDWAYVDRGSIKPGNYPDPPQIVADPSVGHRNLFICVWIDATFSSSHPTGTRIRPGGPSGSPFFCLARHYGHSCGRVCS